MGGSNISHHRSAPAFEFYQIVIQQHQDIVGMEEIALIVNDSDPVCVSVGGNSDIKFLLHHIILQRMQRSRRRSRQFPSKQRIVPVMNGSHFASGRH